MIEKRRSDAELIRAARRGDQSAWNILVERHARLVYAIPLRLRLAPDSATNVFHAVFTQLLYNLGRIRESDDLVTWLAEAALRESKRLRFGVHLSPRLDALSTIRGMPIDEETLRRWEDQQLVRDAVSQLPERCQRLLSIVLFTDHPVPATDLARRLNIPEGRVGPERARCFEMLREVLDAWGFP